MKSTRGIFLGDSASLLIFVLEMILLSDILQKTMLSYDVGRGKGKLNHLLFMDVLKLFPKSGTELEC